MALNIRKPTGRTSWPTVLLAGTKGAGKTYTAIQASSSALVDQGYVLTLGEDVPDDYSKIPGVKFDIVEHDGTYDSILEQVTEVARLASTRKPILFVFDSATPLWELILANVQARANDRARMVALASKRPVPNGNVTMTPEDWETANAEWYAVHNTIRRMPGPTIITARLEDTDKGWRIRGHKDLAFDVSAVVELPERGTFRLTKLKNPENPVTGTIEFDDDWRVENLWTDLGLTGTAPARELAVAVRDAA